MIRSNLFDFSDAYIHAFIRVPNTTTAVEPVNNTNRKVKLKKKAPFTDCISETNNKQVDDAQDIDIVTPEYSLIE